MINFYELSTMDTAQRARLLRRAEIQIDELVERVRPIVEAVRDRGDDALIEFTGRFDRVQLDVDQLCVSRAEIEQAHSQLDSSVRAALEHAIHNIRTFHQRQLPHRRGRRVKSIPRRWLPPICVACTKSIAWVVPRLLLRSPMAHTVSHACIKLPGRAAAMSLLLKGCSMER